MKIPDHRAHRRRRFTHNGKEAPLWLYGLAFCCLTCEKIGDVCEDLYERMTNKKWKQGYAGAMKLDEANDYSLQIIISNCRSVPQDEWSTWEQGFMAYVYENNL